MPNLVSKDCHKFFLLLIGLLSATCTSSFAQISKLKIADNQRFLVKADGSPFVWIGETNWSFAKLPPATIDSILDKRSAQGFTIMFISCRKELYNGQGDPGEISAPNEVWWSYLDDYIAKCAQRNLYVGVTLGWWGKVMDHSAEELYDYGHWVGRRYRDSDNIVWLTMGETGSHRRKATVPDEKLASLVRGIRDGDTGNKLLTVHADYQRGTSLTNDDILCDFNNWQTSQWCCPNDLPRKDERAWTVWEALAYDYNKMYDGRPKPTLDSEAWYENNKDFCGAQPFNIRRRAYFTIFAGGFGHTYGAGGIWDGLQSADSCSRTALKAIHYAGAEHVGYISQFLHRLKDDFLKLRPHQDFVVMGNTNDYETHIQASVAVDSSFALVYSASDSAYVIDRSALAGNELSAVWYNPRTNEYSASLPLSSDRIDPPGASGPGYDWVLIAGKPLTVRSLVAKN